MGAIFTPKPLVTGGGGGEGVNIFEIYIQNEAYIPSFSFLAPKLGVQPSKGGNFTPKTPRYGGKGGGGGGGEMFSKYISKMKLTYQVSASQH